MSSTSQFIYLVTEYGDQRYFVLENNSHEYGNNHENCLSIFEDLVKDSDGGLAFRVLGFDNVNPTIKDQLESFTELKLFLVERILGLK